MNERRKKRAFWQIGAIDGWLVYGQINRRHGIGTNCPRGRVFVSVGGGGVARHCPGTSRFAPMVPRTGESETAATINRPIAFPCLKLETRRERTRVILQSLQTVSVSSSYGRSATTKYPALGNVLYTIENPATTRRRSYTNGTIITPPLSRVRAPLPNVSFRSTNIPRSEKSVNDHFVAAYLSIVVALAVPEAK